MPPGQRRDDDTGLCALGFDHFAVADVETDVIIIRAVLDSKYSGTFSQRFSVCTSAVFQFAFGLCVVPPDAVGAVSDLSAQLLERVGEQTRAVCRLPSNPF